MGWGAPWAGLRHFWELCSLSCVPFPFGALGFLLPKTADEPLPIVGTGRDTDTSRRVGSQHLGRGIMMLCRPARHPSPWPTGPLAGTWAEAPGSPPSPSPPLVPPGERAAGSAQDRLQPRALFRPTTAQTSAHHQVNLGCIRPSAKNSRLDPGQERNAPENEAGRVCTLSICNISDQKRRLLSPVYKASDRRKCPIKALHKLGLKPPALLVNPGSSLCSGLDHGLSIRSTCSPGQAVKCPPCQCLPASWGRRCPGPPRGAPG